MLTDERYKILLKIARVITPKLAIEIKENHEYIQRTGANCPICHKPPRDRKETYVGSLGYMEAGFPWIPSSHRWCLLRRVPIDSFWFLVSLIAYPLDWLYQAIKYLAKMESDEQC